MSLSNSITRAAPRIRSWPRVALVTELQLRTVLPDVAYPTELSFQTEDITFVSIAPRIAWVHTRLEMARQPLAMQLTPQIYPTMQASPFSITTPVVEVILLQTGWMPLVQLLKRTRLIRKEPAILL